MKKQNIVSYEDIQFSLNKGLESICSDFDSLDFSDAKTYGNWLSQTYYYVCHSTRLLAHAAARFTVAHYDKEHIQMIEHAKAERMHERIAIHDLNQIGHKIEDFPELAQTKSLYLSIYSLIDRENPMSMFGYILILETLSLAKGLDIYKAALENFGPKASTYLKLHTEDDVEHLKSYEKILKEANAKDRQDIKDAIEITAHNYRGMLSGIQESAGMKLNMKKAA